MDPAPWTGSEPVRLPFKVPRGRLATWVGGRMMLALSDRTLSRIEQELGELFTDTARHELDFLTAFTATR